MIVTIDGPAAAGKGTLAARLAEKYKLAYFDTGMVYRAVGLEMFLNGEDVTDEVQAEKNGQRINFSKNDGIGKASRIPRRRRRKKCVDCFGSPQGTPSFA